MDDTIALLVGRVILAWGSLDQKVRNVAVTLQANRGQDFEEPDDRFRHRLTLLRRLFARETGGDQSFLAEFDTLRNTIGELERKRAHLAHGIEIRDRRETNEYAKAFRELRKRGAGDKEFQALWKRHYSIQYSRADLVQLTDNITSATNQLARLLVLARQRSRAPKNQMPPPH